MWDDYIRRIRTNLRLCRDEPTSNIAFNIYQRDMVYLMMRVWQKGVGPPSGGPDIRQVPFPSNKARGDYMWKHLTEIFPTEVGPFRTLCFGRDRGDDSGHVPCRIYLMHVGGLQRGLALGQNDPNKRIKESLVRNDMWNRIRRARE